MPFPAAEDAAARLDQAIEEFVAFVQELPDDSLDIHVPGEERSVRVMAYHVAAGLRLGQAWLGPARRGEPVPGDDINAYNAQEALEHAGATTAEVLAIVARDRSGAVEEVRSLTAGEWDVSVPFGPGGGVEMPVSQLAGAGERHIRRHLGNIRAAIEAGAVENPA